YRHPTIRSLAAALADVAPSSPRPSVAAAIEPATPTSSGEYILCGALQGLLFLAYSYLAVLAIVSGYAWVSAGSSVVEMYLRLVLAGSATFLVVCAVPIAAKWVLVGRWQPGQIRLWSLAYVRFWIVKDARPVEPGRPAVHRQPPVRALSEGAGRDDRAGRRD